MEMKECDRCGHYYPEDQLYYDDGEYLCQNCRQIEAANEVKECDRCGGQYRAFELYYDNEYGEWLCPKCRQEDARTIRM